MLKLVPPPANRTWPEVYIYNALIEAGGESFFAESLPEYGDPKEYSRTLFVENLLRFTDELIDQELPDTLLLTEAFSPIAHLMRMYDSLFGTKVKLVGLVHGGSFIPGDVLAMDGSLEKHVLEAYDLLIVPSEYHLNRQEGAGIRAESVVAKWPLKPDVFSVERMARQDRTNQIIFPHRQIPEKGWPLWKMMISTQDGGGRFTGWDFFATGKALTREEYLQELAESKAVFANATMETYGVAIEEAMTLGCCPVLNFHQVYRELYDDCKVHWHIGTVPSVEKALKQVEDCDIDHYPMTRGASQNRAARILSIAENL